jgi:hypothetical protein
MFVAHQAFVHECAASWVLTMVLIKVALGLLVRGVRMSQGKGRSQEWLSAAAALRPRKKPRHLGGMIMVPPTVCVLAEFEIMAPSKLTVQLQRRPRGTPHSHGVLIHRARGPLKSHQLVTMYTELPPLMACSRKVPVRPLLANVICAGRFCTTSAINYTTVTTARLSTARNFAGQRR